MKTVLLSADGDVSAYEVPNIVAENLEQYCMDFCCKWLHESPDAEKYRIQGCVHYNESDFIEYLNTWIFPKEQSSFIENIGWIDLQQDIPKNYGDCEWFNF